MWLYQKKLEYPVNIKNPNPKLAAYIVSQYGGAYQNVRVVLRKKLCKRYLTKLDKAKITGISLL